MPPPQPIAHDPTSVSVTVESDAVPIKSAAERLRRNTEAIQHWRRKQARTSCLGLLCTIGLLCLSAAGIVMIGIGAECIDNHHGWCPATPGIIAMIVIGCIITWCFCCRYCCECKSNE